jgi:acrylyl-CoA reductase (NADPH)
MSALESASMFRALVLDNADGSVTATFRDVTEDALSPGDVVVDVGHSTLNYKDGLVLAGLGRIVRQYPHIPGIDFAGTVRSSASPRFQPGDAVILTGWGVGERHSGGFAQRARVKADWLVPLPEGLTAREAMAVGTAGFTAALAVIALEEAGVRPDSGEVLVTGAAGGVGSVAVSLLTKAGFTVAASTGRPATADYLRALGAKVIVDRATLSKSDDKPLQSARWAGCIDVVGGSTLANVIASLQPGGAVVACGNAAGNALATSVLPFILRGARLVGIDSVSQPYASRVAAWQRIARDLGKDVLGQVMQRIQLADVPEWGARILKGDVQGRVVVDLLD